MKTSEKYKEGGSVSTSHYERLVQLQKYDIPFVIIKTKKEKEVRNKWKQKQMHTT